MALNAFELKESAIHLHYELPELGPIPIAPNRPPPVNSPPAPIPKALKDVRGDCSPYDNSSEVFDERGGELSERKFGGSKYSNYRVFNITDSALRQIRRK